MELCSATAQFESFVLQFLDRCTAVFLLSHLRHRHYLYVSLLTITVVY